MQQRAIRKRKLGSYPFLSVVFSITLSLFIIGLFGALMIVTNALTDYIKENVVMQVYLDKPISSSEITRIEKTISSKNYVLVKEGIPSVQIVSKEEAARMFIKESGEDFVSFLGENPLRDMLIVKVAVNHQSLDSLSWIKKDIEQIRGVFEVNYVESLVSSINKNLAKIGAILIGFTLLLIIVVIVLINNTIKLALFSQRFLIRSMQLVGATSSFIKRPFINRAMGYGFLSGLFASASVYFVTQYAISRIEELSDFYDFDKFLILASILVLSGILIATLSTYAAMRKYLSYSLDELY